MPNLWRVFVPSWRFFDRIGPRPRVFVRSVGESEWTLALVAPPRRWTSLVFNPRGNLHHADQNLVDRLLAEIQNGDGDATAIGESVSYGLLIRRLRTVVPAGEFKISVDGDDVVRAAFGDAP